MGRELGDLADICPTVISRLERGRQLPNLDYLNRIASALQIEVSELLEGIPNPVEL